MKPEFPRNKLANGLRTEKPKESPRVDQAYMSSKYQQIQESNDRLKKLLSKFSSDSEHRLSSVHESVICKALAFQAKRESSMQLKNRPTGKAPSIKYNLGVIVEATGGATSRNQALAGKKKADAEGRSKNCNNVRELGSKNFVLLNKRDAFDPHCLGGRNAQNVPKTVEG